MIVYRGTNKKLDAHMDRLGLTAPVYFVNNHMASLESHKKIFTDSIATTIEEAEAERIAYDKQQAEIRALAQEWESDTNE